MSPPNGLKGLTVPALFALLCFPAAIPAAEGGPGAKTNGTIRVGEEAPPIEGTDLDGSRFSLEDFRGRPLFVDFGSTLCEACSAMVRVMNRLEKTYGSTDLKIIMVADSSVPLAMTKQFFTSREAAFTIIRDEDYRLFESYGVGVIPFKVTIDRDGRIRDFHVGFDEKVEKVMDFKGLLEESP